MIYSFVKSYYIMKSFSLTKRWRNSWTQMYHKTRQFLNPFLFTYTYLISKTMALSFLNFHNMWFCYFFINLIFHVYLNLLAADHFLPEKEIFNVIRYFKWKIALLFLPTHFRKSSRRRSLERLWLNIQVFHN